MVKLRIVFAEELRALARLFFLTEGRNLTPNDYRQDGQYLELTSKITDELKNVLQPFEEETIWAPLWVEGLARGFFSDDADTATKLAQLNQIPNIPYRSVYGPVVFVDRNYYQQAAELARNFENNNWIYTGDVDPRRLITSGILRSRSPEAAPVETVDNYYRIPSEFNPLSARAFESYLLGWPFFVLPNSTSYEQLKSAIRQNYKQTRGRRVIGGRKIEPFADLGWAVSLDSGDELLSLINPNARPLAPGQPLQFPPNPNLTGDEAFIWQYPVKVGDEDLAFELSTFRETNSVDPDYWQYRETQIRNLDPVARNYFTALYLESTD
jgi:hypothetical protein